LRFGAAEKERMRGICVFKSKLCVSPALRLDAAGGRFRRKDPWLVTKSQMRFGLVDFHLFTLDLRPESSGGREPGQ